MKDRYPVHVLKILRQRLGLDKDDTSQDDFLQRYSPEQAMCDLVAWRLGSTDWYDWFKMELEAVGLKIVVSED